MRRTAVLARDDLVVSDEGSRELREIVTECGVEILVVNNLTEADLELIGWSGSPLHVSHVAVELRRVQRGDAEYLAARAPNGAPLAKGGIDYTQEPGVGVIHQLATRTDLQGLGIGTRVIEAAEARIRARGLTTAMLSVGRDNPRAQALYERLGYIACGEHSASWESQREDGSRFLYETVLTKMRKPL